MFTTGQKNRLKGEGKGKKKEGKKGVGTQAIDWPKEAHGYSQMK